MDSWDMFCAFIYRIMNFGDNCTPSKEECSAYLKLEDEILKAYKDRMMDFHCYDLAIRFHHLIKRRKADLFANEPNESFL